jgi:tetratricopeptide (TPR) repeat protein
VELYHEAAALDPYDTIIPLRLAHFQLVCDRQEEAIATARAGLARRPHSLELMDWIYLVSMRLGLPDEAREIVGHALLIAPMEGIWWARQCVLASQRGQGPEAVQALAAALTDDPEAPPFVRAAWAGRVKSEK